MKNTSDVNMVCMHVFANASAAVSHEIKNTLSIINENAGLLEDLLQMTEQDGEIPAKHVLSATSSISKQVARSNVIMKNLNRFAHSADTPLAQVNLEEILSLIVALTGRQAAMKKITVFVACPSDLMTYTYLLPFESLLYLTLCHIYGSTTSESVITVEAVANPPNIIVRFVVKGEKSLTIEKYSDSELVLAEHIKGSFLCQENTLEITFPADINKEK